MSCQSVDEAELKEKKSGIFLVVNQLTGRFLVVTAQTPPNLALSPNLQPI